MRCFIRLPSHRYQQLDTCRVCWQGGATCPQAADLDVDSSEMTGFLPLQDVHCCLPGQASNEPREPCLLSPIHLVDPHSLE